MNIPILIASTLTLIAFFLHTFQGDKELRMIEAVDENTSNYQKQEKWTMARCGWHWVSVDLLFATLALMLINFTNFIENEKFLLQLLSVYFLAYGLAWLIGITISKKFPRNYLVLGQWGLCWIICGLIYYGSI